ncbi:MAG: right-handed parallel beta-helix repeat-containing protein, partial [Bradyrhizobium sp.]|nr:right-handed parallel beta-helix repeat-containing protein [Bradyrhizobium sp.]
MNPFANIHATAISGVVLIIATSAQGFGAVYCVDAASGSDGNPGTSAAPWRSLTKVNAVQASLQPGDSVLLRRGTTFAGPLLTSASGSAGLPITYGAYGDGAKPVITGLVSVTSWTSVGGGVFEATVPSAPAATRVVVLDGAVTAKGRYPNRGTGNGGYLVIDSSSGPNSLTDDALASMSNWTGAEVVIRKNRWIVDRYVISSHAGSTLTFTNDNGYNPESGYGYFIQNDTRVLDQAGEWCFNGSTKQLRMYNGASAPGRVDIAAVENVVVLSGRHDIILDNVAISGGHGAGIVADNVAAITVRNCEMRLNYQALSGTSINGLTIEDTTIDSTTNNGVALTDASNCIVRRVNVSRTGLFAGNGGNGDGTYTGINFYRGSGNLIDNFVITDTGYTPITFQGSDFTISNGFIDRYALTKDDGGAIYCWDGGNIGYFNRRIFNNIVLDGIGSPGGTRQSFSWCAYGIYLDDGTNNV